MTHPASPPPAPTPADYYFAAPAPVLALPVTAGPDGTPPLRTFSGVALSGAPVNHRCFGPLVIDLASLILPPACPVLIEHAREQRVGVATFAVRADTLEASGRLLRNADAQALAADADEGFPWQLSVHAEPGVVETVGADARVPVNGRPLAGPLTIWRHTAIRELSFTPTGVDAQTHAHVFSTPATDAPADAPTPLTLAPEAHSMADPIPDPAAQVAALTAQLDALKTRADAAEAALKAERQAQRTQAVQALFSELGLPVPAQSMPHYLALDPDAFAAFAVDLRAARQPDPAHLFSEQAVTGRAADRQRADDALVERMAKL